MRIVLFNTLVLGINTQVAYDVLVAAYDNGIANI